VLLRHPSRTWPGFLLAAFAAHLGLDLGQGRGLWASSLDFCGNAVEAVAGAWLLRTWAGGVPSLERIRDVVLLFLVGAVGAPLLHAGTGVALLARGVETAVFGWTGDLLGVLLVTPAVLAWGRLPSRPAGPGLSRRWAVAVLVGLLALVVGHLLQPAGAPSLFKPYLVFPLLIWSGFRFGPRGAIPANLLVAFAAGWPAVHGHGLFPPEWDATPVWQQANVQVFLGLAVMSSLLSAAARDELERRVEQRTRELQASEERVRLALDAANAGAWEWDLRTNRNFWTEQLWRLYGLEPDGREASYALWRDAILPEDRPGAEQVVQENARAGREFELEWRTRSPDGTERWLMSRGHPLRHPEGRVIRYHGIVLDVTARKRAEQAAREARRELEALNASLDQRVEARTRELAESEERLHRLFEHHQAAMLLLEPGTGAILDANGAAVSFYGLPREDLCRMRLADLLAPDVGAADWERIQEPSAAPVLLEQRGGSGQVHWVEIHATRIPLRERWVLFAIVHDVTDRRRAEAELHKLSQTVEQCPVPVLLTDRAGVIEYVNHAWSECTGYALAEARGQTPRLVRSGVQPREFYQALWETLREGRAWHGEICNARRDGTPYWTLATIAPIRDLAGRTTHFVSVQEDITGLKATTTALEQARVAAEAADRAKSTFLANMSHEIRTPLNAILGYGQLLQGDPSVPAAARAKLETIHRSGVHLLSLVNAVLEMAKIDSGRVEAECVEFDLGNLLRDLEVMFQPAADLRALAFAVTVPPGLPRRVSGDETKLRQVLVNLLGNAFKFTPEGRVELRVTWRSEPETEWLVAEVEDTGPGIAPGEEALLFAAFEQTRTGRQSQSGTGLGLAISRRYAEVMGGELTLQPKAGPGCVFRLRVPVRPVRGEAAEPGGRRRLVVGLARGQEPLRVLLVDDDEASRTWLGELLRLVGLTVREAADGQEAVDLWDSWRPRLVLMDLRMPVLDGHEATRRIKASPGGAATVILAVTAAVFEEDRQAIVAAGAADLLTKPLDSARLFAWMERHLGVRFRYAGDPDFPDEGGQAAGRRSLVPGDLEALPEALRRDLRRAVMGGDPRQIEALLQAVRTREPGLGPPLEALARDYEYEALLRLLDLKGSAQ
jgi:PAS domain S-box-containing protein